MKYQSPPHLAKGDKVILLTPAGFIKNENPILLAEQLLKEWGLIAIRGEHILKKEGHFAGSDEERLEDFQNALDNPEIKAIWAIRGGYGSVRILSHLNFDLFKKHPKWIIGYSDITAIHNVVHNLGFMSIHAVMPINLHKEEDSKAIESLKNILFGEMVEEIIPASNFNKLGSVKGVLVGGNLSLLQSLSGSPFQIKTRGKILFIEEIGEELYRIDRMMQSLKHAGFFKDLIGLAVGSFSDLKHNETPYGKTYQEIILETVEEYNYPTLFDVPAGHIDDNRALLFGGETIINVGEFVSCIRFIQ